MDLHQVSVCIPLLLLLLGSCHQHADAYPETLSNAVVTEMRAQIRAAIDLDLDENDSSFILMPGLVRLIFHDCVGEGCDGCVNMDMDDNAGLGTYINTTEDLYQSGEVDGTPFTELLSRADFWILAGIEAIDYSTERAQRPCNRGCDIVYTGLVFQTGRQDCELSPYDDAEPEYPSSFANTEEVMDFFDETFGFSKKETVAILGAHTLGSAHRSASGHAGPWVRNAREFDNQYYIDLLDSENLWAMNGVGNRNTKYQWSANINPNGTNIMMLDSDMCLIKDLGTIDQDNGEVTGCTYSTCPDAEEDVLDWVKEFAVDNELFLEEFGKACQKMISNGYDSLNDLTD